MQQRVRGDGERLGNERRGTNYDDSSRASVVEFRVTRLIREVQDVGHYNSVRATAIQHTHQGKAGGALVRRMETYIKYIRSAHCRGRFACRVTSLVIVYLCGDTAQHCTAVGEPVSLCYNMI